MNRSARINGLMALLSFGSLLMLLLVTWGVGWTPWVLLVPLPGAGAVWFLAGLQDV